MHIPSGKAPKNNHRRCRHAPHIAATDPATCSEGNAEPRTRPKCSIKLIVVVNGPPCKDPCNTPAIENNGLSIGKKIAIKYPNAYTSAEYCNKHQYACRSTRQI